MNYYDEVSENRDPVTDTFIRAGPDCAPHPFDLMALHALYQTVPVGARPGGQYRNRRRIPSWFETAKSCWKYGTS